MMRKRTPQSRTANAAERKFIYWLKERGVCIACGNIGGVIAHHFAGSSAKVDVNFERVQIGNFAVNGLCQCCDNLVTRSGRPAFREAYGQESALWLLQIQSYPIEIPLKVIQGVINWGKHCELQYE